MESVSPFDVLVLGAFRYFSYSLANSSQLVGIRCVPKILILGVASQLAMLKGFACDIVYYRHGPVKDKFAGETSLGRLEGVHHNMMVEPLCSRLRSCVFRDRLRACCRGLVGQWRGPSCLCTVDERLLLFVTSLIYGHCWR